MDRVWKIVQLLIHDIFKRWEVLFWEFMWTVSKSWYKSIDEGPSVFDSANKIEKYSFKCYVMIIWSIL